MLKPSTYRAHAFLTLLRQTPAQKHYILTVPPTIPKIVTRGLRKLEVLISATQQTSQDLQHFRVPKNEHETYVKDWTAKGYAVAIWDAAQTSNDQETKGKKKRGGTDEYELKIHAIAENVQAIAVDTQRKLIHVYDNSRAETVRIEDSTEKTPNQAVSEYLLTADDCVRTNVLEHDELEIQNLSTDAPASEECMNNEGLLDENIRSEPLVDMQRQDICTIPVPSPKLALTYTTRDELEAYIATSKPWLVCVNGEARMHPLVTAHVRVVYAEQPDLMLKNKLRMMAGATSLITKDDFIEASSYTSTVQNDAVYIDLHSYKALQVETLLYNCFTKYLSTGRGKKHMLAILSRPYNRLETVLNKQAVTQYLMQHPYSLSVAREHIKSFDGLALECNSLKDLQILATAQDALKMIVEECPWITNTEFNFHALKEDHVTDAAVLNVEASIAELLFEKDQLGARIINKYPELIKSVTLQLDPPLVVPKFHKGCTNRFKALVEDDPMWSKGYRYTVWTSLAYKIMSAHQRLAQVQDTALMHFCRLVNKKMKSISFTRTLEQISELDCHIAFATVSLQYEWSLPTVVEEPKLVMEGFYNPLLFEYANHNIVRNNVEMSAPLLLSGPNMGGKSTYLKGIAYVFILAQAGCCVPAVSACIGITDRIMARIGAEDVLQSNLSTFMYEAHHLLPVLHPGVLSPNSLLLVDELGRGTNAQEGIAFTKGVVDFTMEMYNGWMTARRIVFVSHLVRGSHSLVKYKLFEGFHCADGYGLDFASTVLPDEITARAWQIRSLLVKSDQAGKLQSSTVAIIAQTDV